MVMTKEEFLQIAKKINQVYRDRQPITKDGFDIWYEMLQDLDAGKLNVATTNYIKANKFPPTIADLREEYRTITDHIAEVNSELRTIYDRTRGVYPNTHLDDDEETRTAAEKDARDAWTQLICQKPFEERIAFAERVEQTTIKYVRMIEEGDRNQIPTLAEFFRGAR